MDVVNETIERIGGGASGGGGVGFVEAVEVNDGRVNIPQVNNFGLLVAVLMEDSVCTNEEENPNAHDERTEDLQPIRVQIPAERFNAANQITDTCRKV